MIWSYSSLKFMRNFYFVLCLVFSLPISLRLNAEGIEEERLASVIRVADTPQDTLKTWKEHIEYAMERSRERMAEASDTTAVIQCVGYRYKGKVNNEAERRKVIDAFFADNAPAAGETSLSHYQIVPMKTFLAQLELKGGERPLETLKNRIAHAVRIGTELIEIDWRYRGRIYHSMGIIYGNDIIDSVGSLMLDNL